MKLTDAEIAEIDGFLGRIHGAKIPNTEALDGFFAAIACCPDMIMPSEYMPLIQSGATEDHDLVFEDMGEAQRFMALISRHYNHVNAQLQNEEVYLPLVLEDDNGIWRANDWANGFILGTRLRFEIWSEIIDSEERGGAMVPIFALAYENHPDPSIRPYQEPIEENQREELLISAAAGVMRMHAYFMERRGDYLPDAESRTFVREGGKIGRNEPCPCGSGRKFKQCCGKARTLH